MLSGRCLRHFLKDREAKVLLGEVSSGLGVDLASVLHGKIGLEEVKLDFGEVFLVGGRPLLFKVAGGRVFPTLLFSEFFGLAPRVVVDMGAVPYVCKGADVMRPGVVRFEGDFKVGSCVFVVDVKFGKALAVGEATLDKNAAECAKQGIVVRNVHYVGDKVWSFLKQV